MGLVPRTACCSWRREYISPTVLNRCGGGRSAPGLVLGFEFNPGSYRYDVIQIAPRGFDVYTASHQSVRVFEMPMLKLGIRF